MRKNMSFLYKMIIQDKKNSDEIYERMQSFMDVVYKKNS